MLSPQTIKYILLTSLIFISFIIVVFEWICHSSTGCKCYPYSLSKESTIEDGSFINSYYPIITSIQIPGTRDTIILDSAWTEYSRTKKRFLGLCIFERDVVVKDFSGNTFSFPFDISPDSKAFVISFKSLPFTENDGDIYQHQVDDRYTTMHLKLKQNDDTVKVLLTNLDTTIINRIDTILFVKRK